eukprot:270698_1
MGNSESSKPEQSKDFAKWDIFSNNNKWTIIIYKGTPVCDIKETIIDVTGIKKFVCMDADSNIIVLSSYLPTGTKIFIQSTSAQHKHKQNINESDDMKQDDFVQFHWDKTTLISNGNHILSKNRLEFSETSNSGWGGIMTDTCMKDSIYIWSTIYTKWCCPYEDFFLICHKKLMDSKKKSDFKFEYSTFSNECSVVSGVLYDLCDAGPFKNLPYDAEFELIHVVDMKKKLYWIFGANYAKPLYLCKNLPVGGVYFAQGIKHEIKCRIKSLRKLEKIYKLESCKETKVETINEK